ncbi:hypothetical protein [Candidatus Protochlamydia phocaeensis]|uniref:hypothetical protein n=1 Tax=Candidatus Protochlamydia phocaeensis TaxID=1414722 RepID=UPI000838171B|nr:hypothetical protein [Candidatus Protochlamydia phocaeensis]
MVFPIQFARSQGDYDFISPIINITGNATVLAVGGISLGVITTLALKALGFSKLTTSLAAAIPITIGAFGTGVALIGAGFIISILIAMAYALGRR